MAYVSLKKRIAAAKTAVPDVSTRIPHLSCRKQEKRLYELRI